MSNIKNIVIDNIFPCASKNRADDGNNMNNICNTGNKFEL